MSTEPTRLQRLQSEKDRLSAAYLDAYKRCDWPRFQRLIAAYRSTNDDYWRERDAVAAETRRLQEEVTGLHLRSRKAKRQHQLALASMTGAPRPALDVDLATDWLLQASEGVGVGPFERFRAHVAALCREHRIEAKYVIRDTHRQAYAFSKLRVVELPAIWSAWDYSTALHEVGHVVRPCVPSHVRVKTASGGTLCVRCELNAWQFAIAGAIRWDRLCHDSMRTAIVTYRKYGTPSEQAEIDRLASADGFRRARIERATREIQEADRRLQHV